MPSFFKKSLLLTAFGAIALVGIYPTTSEAQTSVVQGNIQLSSTPQSPSAYQTVVVKAVSYTSDLSNSYIEWFQNDEKITGGVGLTSFSFKTGAFGALTEIIVRARTQTGETLQQSLKITPADINLVYEAISYVPPFYRGKALYGYQTPVRITATPEISDANGEKIGSDSLIFSWWIDNRLQQNLSGLGKNTIIFEAQIPLKETAVMVTASTLDRGVTASKRIDLKPAEPKVILYELSPLYGLMLNSALTDSKQLSGQEMSLAAIPYFFDTDKPTNAMLYTWSMNERVVSDKDKKNTLTVRQVTEESGTSNVSVNAKHIRDMFEFGDARVSVSFGPGQKTGAF